MVALLKANARIHGELGPRGVRAFIFRYQLARLILEALGNDQWTPENLATTIANCQSGQKGAPTPEESMVVTVARQVA